MRTKGQAKEGKPKWFAQNSTRENTAMYTAFLSAVAGLQVRLFQWCRQLGPPFALLLQAWLVFIPEFMRENVAEIKVSGLLGYFFQLLICSLSSKISPQNAPCFQNGDQKRHLYILTVLHFFSTILNGFSQGETFFCKHRKADEADTDGGPPLLKLMCHVAKPSECVQRTCITMFVLASSSGQNSLGVGLRQRNVRAQKALIVS